MQPSGIANTGAPLDPANYDYTPVAGSFGGNYDDGIMDLIGLVPEVDAIYNYDKSGNPITLGAPIKREYKWNEYDFYAQGLLEGHQQPHSNLSGLHYSYLQAPTEINGSQVSTCVVTDSGCTPYSLGQFYDDSFKQGATGGAASNVPTVSFDLSGRSNHRADFWKPDTKDFAPRIAFAYSPSFFGGTGRTSIRGGYSLVFDHFGAGIVNSFDTSGSFGLSSNVSNFRGRPDRIDSSTLPGTSTPSPPACYLPHPSVVSRPCPTLELSPSAGAPTPSSKLPTSMSSTSPFSISSPAPRRSKCLYVGRLAHRLLEQEDVAMPLDLTAAGTDYFAAASALAAQTHQGVPVGQVAKAAYWETLFAPLAGQTGFCDLEDWPNQPYCNPKRLLPLSAKHRQRDQCAFHPWTFPEMAPGPEIPIPLIVLLPRSVLRSVCVALHRTIQLPRSRSHLFRQHFGSGLEADFNYTYSHSIDWTSQAERLGSSGGNNGAQIINSWKPDQLHGTSDFDMTQQLNANWIWDIPVGHKRHFLATSSRIIDTIIGGWHLTGILRLTSGLPYAVDDGSRWPTNWDIEGFGTLPGKIPSAAPGKRGHGQQRYADPVAVYNSFRQAYPGESGTRNPLRGDGFYDWDAGLNKTFQLFDRAHLQFRWETFNLTNSVRFDPQSISSRLDEAASFGNAFGLLTQPRVMQVAARIEF